MPEKPDFFAHLSDRHENPWGKRAKPELRLLEGEDVGESLKPDSVVDNIEIAHGAANSEDKLHNLERTAEALGCDKRQEIDEVREEIYGLASKQDKTAKLVEAVIAEQMLEASAAVISKEDVYRRDGFKSVSLIQPDRIAHNDQPQMQMEKYRQKYPDFYQAAKELSGDYPEYQAANNEGVSQFYEKMTGVSASEMRSVTSLAEHKIKKFVENLNDVPLEYGKKSVLKDKCNAIHLEFNNLCETPFFLTINPNIVLPGVMAHNGAEPYAEYYFDGAPESAIDAKEYVAQMKRIITAVLGLAEQLKTSPNKDEAGEVPDNREIQSLPVSRPNMPNEAPTPSIGRPRRPKRNKTKPPLKPNKPRSFLSRLFG
ncbi:MAG: hypothetical protein BWY19_00062 [bacterium ADurb.Bin212]|nr:MAG: hypothetical protein BWY19_00062 [bacterium ADurb.Bin212]